jgi:hypothetical protein
LAVLELLDVSKRKFPGVLRYEAALKPVRATDASAGYELGETCM